jgi:hypothetical protein
LSRHFYRAEITAPGPVKAMQAHYDAAMARLDAAAHRFAVAYNRETIHAIAGAMLDLRRMIEQHSQALMGTVNVVDLQNGNFHVSWAGNQQIVNGPAVPATVQNFQQQRNGAQMQLQQAQGGLVEMNDLGLVTLVVEPPAIAEAAVCDREATAIYAHVPLPIGPAYVVHDAPLAGLALDTAATDRAALVKEKAALEQRIARLRAEATRKRQLAAQNTQIFGINGTWFVRWANVELVFPSQADALATGVPQVDALKAQRIAEADALDAEANALELQLPALMAQIATLDASLAVLGPDYQAKLAAHPGGLTIPEDTARPRPKWRTWIGVPPEHVDPMWEDLYREWQARKDALRNKLIAMGASQATIDKAMQEMDHEFDPRKKWMGIFCDEPIKLTFNFVNQFTDFTIDPAKVKWCVEYENHLTGQIETVEVGTGGELCLTPEQAKQIYQHAQLVQQQNIGISVVVTITAKFLREYPDGTTRKGETDQQVIITNTTRAQHDAIYGGLPR